MEDKLKNKEAGFVTVVETGEKVKLLHYGFELVIVEFKGGHQEAMKPKDVGLKNRTRPKATPLY